MKITELIKQIQFWKTTDRIGPDIPWTHWKLYFKSTMLSLCNQKFNYFGENAEMRAGAYVIGCSNVYIGNRVIIRPNCMFFGEDADIPITIKIEDNVMMGSGVHIYVNNHRFDITNIPAIDQGYYPTKPVVLKNGCWIGANVIILPGVEIGENSVVGAGSVVTKSIMPRTVVAGNPAKLIRTL